MESGPMFRAFFGRQRGERERERRCWRGEEARGNGRRRERGRGRREAAKRSSQVATTPEMTFSLLLSPPPLPLPSPTVTAASYLISAVHGLRRRRPLEHGCRCGRPPETAFSGSSGRRDSYGDEDTAPRPLGLDGSSASSSGRQTGEPRRAIRACHSLAPVLLTNEILELRFRSAIGDREKPRILCKSKYYWSSMSP